MPKKCFLCGFKYIIGGDITLHSLPKKDYEREKWLKLLNWTEKLEEGKCYNLCSNHFSPSCFRKINMRKTLKHGSLPNEMVFGDNIEIKEEIVLPDPEPSTSIGSIPNPHLPLKEIKSIPFPEKKYRKIAIKKSSNSETLTLSSPLNYVYITNSNLPFNGFISSLSDNTKERGDVALPDPEPSASIGNTSNPPSKKNENTAFSEQKCRNIAIKMGSNSERLKLSSPLKYECMSSKNLPLNELILNFRKKGLMVMPRYFGDYRIEHMANPKLREKYFNLSKKLIGRYKKKTIRLQQQIRRLEASLNNIKDFTSY